MKKMLVTLALTLSLLPIYATAAEKNAPAGDELIQIAILLHASNSLDGLIEQASCFALRGLGLKDAVIRRHYNAKVLALFRKNSC